MRDLAGMLSNPEAGRFSDEVVKPFSDRSYAISGMVASVNRQGQEVQIRFVVVLSQDNSVALVAI